MHQPFYFFFFNDPPTTEIYTLSLHDALPIFYDKVLFDHYAVSGNGYGNEFDYKGKDYKGSDRKSTRLNSSHPSISYAVFCLKKKKNHIASCQSLSYSPVAFYYTIFDSQIRRH